MRNLLTCARRSWDVAAGAVGARQTVARQSAAGSATRPLLGVLDADIERIDVLREETTHRLENTPAARRRMLVAPLLELHGVIRAR